MILIADSGGTKCDWIAVENDATIEFTTEGINPMFSKHQDILTILQNSEAVKIHDKSLSIYFYGAACSTRENIAVVADALAAFFSKATIEVNHDLLAAARASCGHEKSFCAIIGTGSNLCYYDGKEVHRNTKSLGFILGDEGSGSYLGKQLLRAYLYEEMPQELLIKFEEKYPKSKSTLLRDLYTSPKPNQFIANFAQFAHENKSHPFIHHMLLESFSAFFSLHLWKYPDFRRLPVNFVGSIAYYFQDILQEVAINHRFTAGKFVQKPIKELATYHQNNL